MLNWTILNWEMPEREYSAEMLDAWGPQIRLAEEMLREAHAFTQPTNCQIILSPNDFLDLCAGRWHGKAKEE